MTDPKQNPRVGVIVPCYNLGRYINEAVDSVLAQTLQDFEIIVVNDGSTDEYTNALLANYKKDKTRVFTTENRGVCGARNLGIAHASAPYILCLDADDILEPTCLEKTLAVLQKRSDIGIAGFWYTAFGGEEWEYKPDSCTLMDILVENRICVSAMFPKRAWEEVGGYDERLTGVHSGMEDWDFWIGVLKREYKAHIIKEFLLRYRVRDDSASVRSKVPKTRYAIMELIIEKHKDVYRKNAVEVLLGKEKLIGELLDWARQQDATKEWLLKWDEDQKNYIHNLLEDKEYFLTQIDSLGEDNERQKSELGRRQDEIDRCTSALAQQAAQIAHQQHVIDLKDHELRSIYLSKVWKMGNAFKDARHSLKGAVLLPARLLDLGCPDSMKRFIKKAMLVQPQEVLKKSFYKFPYRLADKMTPRMIREHIPCQIRNMARAIFRTTNEKLYKQKKWNGPLVSVVIPCYNYGSYIEEALESVLQQTIRGFEIIIVDDGSEDPFTVAKLQQIESRNIPNLRVIHQSNQGPSAARNKGIKVARGKYICCLDADDVVEPTYFEKCLTILEKENIDVCYSFFKVFGDEEWIARPEAFDAAILKYRNGACGAAIFKKSIWRKAGGYNPDMKHGYEDWDFWISVAKVGGVGKVIEEPLFHYRRHGQTVNKNAEMQHNLLYAQIRKNHPGLFTKNRYKKKKIYYKVINPEVNISVAPKPDRVPR